MTPAQPVRFSTYGVPMIIGEIRRFLRDNNALRVSRSLRDTAYRAMQSRETLEKQLGREPTMDEIAQAAGLARREVTAALESVVEPISLEEPVYTDGGDAMYVIDQVRDPDGEDSWISGLQFRQTVAGLTPREKRIMELRYLQGKTQMEVAREIGISQAQVSRLEKGALEPVPHPGLNLKKAAQLPFCSEVCRLLSAAVFAPGGRTAAQMPLCLIAGQNRTHLPEQLRLQRPQPHRNILVHGGLAAPEHRCRRTHCGPVGRDIFAQLYRPLFGVSLHIQTPPIVNLWYSLCTGRGRYVPPGLDFCAGRAILLHGHKNRVPKG